MTLPIEDVLPELLAALRSAGRAVLQAPPGAGKTTRVPLAILESGLSPGKIVMLEPRRLAARAAAERMAETLGEAVGQTVGYRMRGAAKSSTATRIEVVTEGILTRMVQSDPELSGIGTVIFDEFHERSLNADLGLALVWELRGALREDLKCLVMSATLDAAPVAALLDDAPLISSEGRSFPVDLRYLDRPLPKERRLEQAVADQVRQALSETDGGILVFLPGEGEIRRVQSALGDVPGVRPLYGALPFAQQRAAVLPSPDRKVVLATAIAETALTIQDICVVIDAGRARRARFEPGRGMSQLVTERVSRAEATQRAGRAGRVAPGVCYRMWTKGEEGGLLPFPPPEIAAADLTGLVLELALWGAAPEDLAFLTPPPKTAWDEAQALLRSLSALDATGITVHGRALAKLPLHPRLGHMLTRAGAGAALLAALLNDRDPLRGEGADLDLRLRALTSGGGDPALKRIREDAKRLRRLAPKEVDEDLTPAEMAALAYPDRVGLRRAGEAPRYVLSGGTGATLDEGDALAGARLIVATDVAAKGREGQIRQAAVLTEAQLRGLYADQITWVDVCTWSRRERRVIARKQERFGALVLEDRRWPDAPADQIAKAMCEGVRELGLPWSAPARRLQARIELMRGQGAPLPDCSDDGLLADLDWLLPYLSEVQSAAELGKLDITEALKAHLGWQALSDLDALVPAQFKTPLGRMVPIDYSGGVPEISVRLQEMLGVTTHPVVGPKRAPLKVTLLSPAQRPLQTTMDLVGFWATSYADVRKEMRGRYPRHHWPEDPSGADPTLRAKPRG